MTEGDYGEGDGLAEQVGQALAAMFNALVMLAMFGVMVLARALQAVFVLMRPTLLFASAAAAGLGAYLLFPTVANAYGGDVFALVLALALVAIVPAALILLALDQVGLWPTLWASAGLMFLAHFVISRAPPMVLALLPVLALSACILYFAFGQNFHIEGENQNEQEW